MQFKAQGRSNIEVFVVSPDSLCNTDEASKVNLSNFCVWEGKLEDFLTCNLS